MSSLRSAAIRSFIALAVAARSLSASGLPSNSTSSSLRLKFPAIAPPGSLLASTTAPTPCSGSHSMSLLYPIMLPPWCTTGVP